MKITKFKLIDGGRGLDIEAEQLSTKSSMLIMDKISILRKIPVSDELKNAIANLKYSYLNLTGHWMPPFSAYTNDERTCIPELTPPNAGQPGKSNKTHELIVKLWDHTQVNGALINRDTFMIMGQIEVLDGKKIAINTPYIREDDDFHFYNETVERIKIVIEAIVEFLSSDKVSLQNATKILLGIYKDNKESIVRIKGQDEEENYNELFAVIGSAGGARALKESNRPEEETVVHDSKSTIDEKSYQDPEAEEQEENW